MSHPMWLLWGSPRRAPTDRGISLACVFLAFVAPARPGKLSCSGSDPSVAKGATVGGRSSGMAGGWPRCRGPVRATGRGPNSIRLMVLDCSNCQPGLGPVQRCVWVWVWVHPHPSWVPSVASAFWCLDMQASNTKGDSTRGWSSRIARRNMFGPNREPNPSCGSRVLSGH